jgi:hypothetical protein
MRALLLVLTLTACSKKTATDTGPACPDVVDHMVIVMRQGLTGHSGVDLGDRQQMIAQCEARHMNATERRCMATAKDLAQLASCRPKPAQPVPIPMPAPAPAVPGSGAGSGAGSGR